MYYFILVTTTCYLILFIVNSLSVILNINNIKYLTIIMGLIGYNNFIVQLYIHTHYQTNLY